MKILLTNCWQAGNTGDVAIWKNLMRHLRGEFPDVKFLVASQDIVEWDKKQLSKYDPIYYFDLIRAVHESDIVISQGGGYMIGNNMYQYLSAFALAQKLGKPTFFSTQTFVGPIHDTTKKLLAEVLNKAIVVSPRDKGTYDLMVLSGVDKEKLIIAPDTVFDIGINEFDFPYQNAVKMSIRGYNVDSKMIDKFALLADMISETMGKVVFIPIGNSGKRDDRPLALSIRKNMRHESFVITDPLSAESLKNILKDGMLISDRYHGIIYSASMCTPFVALSPDISSKMPGLMDLLNYPYPTIFDKSFNVDEFFSYILTVWSKRQEIRQHLEKKIPQIKKDSAVVYQKIIKGIHDHHKK